MYAVIQDRTQQYRVAVGDRVLLAYHAALEPGASLTFDQVCAVGGDTPRIGTPFVEGARVSAEVLGTVKGEKVSIQKFRRRKNYRRHTGFRARYTAVRIQSIDA